MRYAVWAAVSTVGQAKGWESGEENIDDKDSLPEQERKCRAAGEGRGWVYTGSYVAPGASRTMYVNLRDAEEQIPALRQMLEDAKAGKFDILIMYDYNRLRDLLDPVAKSLTNYGVQIYSTNQPVEPLRPEEYSPHASDTGQMMQGLNQIVSRWQLADLIRKFQYGTKGRVDKGLPGISIPYGYMKPPGRESESKVIAIAHPRFSLVVIEIKEKFLAGESIHAIAQYLSDRYPSPSGISKWGKTTVRNILKNPFYAGKIVWRQRIVVRDSRSGIKKRAQNPTPYTNKGAHEPLYSYQDYLAVQSEFEKRSAKPTQVMYPWSGMLWCAECSNRLRRKVGRYTCLHCSNVVIHDKELVEKVPYALQSKLRNIDPEPPAAVIPNTRLAIQDLEAKRKKIHHGFELDLYTLAESQEKIKDIEAKVKALSDGEMQAMKIQAERNQFLITLQEAQELLDDFPAWMMEDDVNIVNGFIFRLFKCIKITSQGDVVPVLRRK